MQDFPPNSRAARETAKPAEEPKRVERVVSGEATRRKKGLGRQFKEVFIAGDLRTTFHYVVLNVLIPGARDMLYDTAHSSFERMIYGDSPRARRGGAPTGYTSSPLGRVDYTPYNRMGPPTQQSASTQSRMLSRAARTRHDFDEIVIPSRQDAEEVLERMYDLLSRSGVVTVADLYELTGIQSSHTDYKWGWQSLRGSRVARLRTGGYLLDLPEPQGLEVPR